MIFFLTFFEVIVALYGGSIAKKDLSDLLIGLKS
jgi:hypothetical protein